MKKFLLLFTMVLLASCSGVKKTQKAINSGNYTVAMNKALKELQKNKTKKGHQSYVVLLEDAFQRHSDRERERISFLEKDGNPANLQAIYTGLVGLRQLQQQIQPLLPLPIYDENRDATFRFTNYDNKILNTKNELSDYLYANASELLQNAATKFDYRDAYEQLRYLNELNPGYANLSNKLEEAYQKGLDYIKVELNNNTQQVIPKRLETELLAFNTYGINDFWSKFHAEPVAEINYDYALELDFTQINVSPERINETQIVKEKLVRDGFDYQLDRNGNVAKDSLGNDIKVDRYAKVQCNYYEFTQLKTAQIGARVNFVDLGSGQQINSYPLSSEFIFEHVYANFDGDRRALDNDVVALLDLAEVPFPTNEQMIYDAGEDIKARLKTIVNRNNFN